MREREHDDGDEAAEGRTAWADEWTASLALPFPPPTLRDLTDAFNHGFGSQHDIHDGMAAVNELLERPLSYRGLLVRLRGTDEDGECRGSAGSAC